MTRPTTQDYYRIRWVGACDLSPDGETLAYVRTRVLPPCKEVSEIILRSAAGDPEETLCEGTDPSFSPDGRTLLLTRRVEGVPQLFLHDLGTHEERQLTTMRFGATSATWSPTGEFVAFCSRVHRDVDSALWDRAPSAAEREDERLRRVRHPYVSFEGWSYKSDEDGGFSVERSSTLWVVRVADGAQTLLAGAKEDERDSVMPTFSPDGHTIVFASNRCRVPSEGIAMDLFRVAIPDGEVRRLTAGPSVAYYPAPFQPLVTRDGDHVVFGALDLEGTGEDIPPTRLYLAELGEGIAPGNETSQLGKPAPLWPEEAPCHEATCFLYNCENLGQGARPTGALSSDGRWLYFVAGWHGAANLYRASLDAEHPAIEALTTGERSVRSVSAASGRVLVSCGCWTQTPQLFMADEGALVPASPGDAWPFSRLTDENPWFRETLRRPQELWVRTLDGRSHVQGWVFAPEGADEAARRGQRAPAVVYVHGGPTPMMGCALTYEHQCILGAGMGLIMMNFRGSSGYGPAHQSVRAAYDGTAMTDILQFVDEACRENPWIDPERLGITGGSYGGYMTAWICGHTKRFKAAVVQRGVANELIQYASSDMPGSSEGYADLSDFMVEELRKSPVSYAEKIDIPLLILHGTADMRCPIENAHQLFTAVKEFHPDGHVRMVLFPGMTHSFPMSGPMDLRIAHYDAMIDWFRTYL